MSTLNFPDANVWLALIWDRHIHSEVARKWFDQEGDASFLFCRFTQLTVLRLLTTASVMGGDVRSMKGAWDIWDRIASDERIKFLAEPQDLDALFRKHSQSPASSPKGWADAYLLAFARAAGLKLVTLDKALARRGAESFLIE